MSEDTQAQIDGLEDDEATAVGFGGQRIDRILKIDEEFFVLLHCRVVSTKKSKKKSDGDGLKFSAGAATKLLAELDARTATQLAADHG